jgi:hypothetical protein
MKVLLIRYDNSNFDLEGDRR